MRVLLLTPPFTQINTPYPATAFLKRFLVGKGMIVRQLDLGINLFLSIFSRPGLEQIFEQVRQSDKPISKSSQQTLQRAEFYAGTIDTVISFLQIRDTAQAYAICKNGFLPWGSRFNQPVDQEQLFGSLGLLDKACYLSTLYLEDLSDFIRSELIPEFGFSRYAERLALSATDFTPLHEKLISSDSLIDRLLFSELTVALQDFQPELVGISIPFPGCLFGALQCGRIIKQFDSSIRIVLGGGYVNTELRELGDAKLFNYADYVILDQGEQPLLSLIHFLSQGSTPLLRTFCLEKGEVVYHPGSECDAPFAETGFPDYSDLELKRYLSLIEIPNKMHRLWNDGKWNKMMVARGCYWSKCAFCDVTLDYIKNYQTLPAETLVDRMEQVIAETSYTGFHFVDEAAPPGVLKRIALELLRRKLAITWWTNIRFENNFSPDLCKLLAKSGCIAVSGGLETVSERLLALMNKGISIPQAIQVLGNFTRAGILVHAYLMYGFPTQTAQETIDSLEIVRQLFKNNLIHSCYWHRFALTAHSLVAQNPERFKVKITGPKQGSFAWNDLEHADPTGCNHDSFARGLEKAVYNYMFEIGLDFKLAEWFDNEIPVATIASNFVQLFLQFKAHAAVTNEHKQVIWLGSKPILTQQSAKAGKKGKFANKLEFLQENHVYQVKVDPKHANWLNNLLPRLRLGTKELLTLEQLSEEYELELQASFQSFQQSELWQLLRNSGLLII